MSGRGRNNCGGRRRGGGRGRGKNNNSSSKSSNSKPAGRKTLADHNYSIGSAKQASDYSVITQFIINHVRKTFEFGDDIGDALETRKEVTLAVPKLEPVQQDNPNKEIKEKQNELLYKARVTAYVAREEKYVANKGKAYALIYGQCNKALQHKLQLRTDFEDVIKGNLIKLLDAISEHSMSYMENNSSSVCFWLMQSRTTSTRSRQKTNCWWITREGKSAKKIMETQIGGEIELPKLANLDTNWMDPMEVLLSDAVKVEDKNSKECKARAYKRFTTYLYLENEDQIKYGSLLSRLATQYSLGQDQYPQTVEEATNVLSNHKFDQTYYDKKKRSQGNQNNGNNQQQ